MSAPDPEQVTRLLQAARSGDDHAYDRVFQAVYRELHTLAHHVRRGRASETLNTTALIHEAYLHLLPSRGMEWEGRSHFLGVAARAMRQILVRAADKRTAAKRGGGETPVPLEDSVAHSHPALGSPRPGGGVAPERVLRLDAALKRLEAVAPRQARVVECRYFAGLTVEETAAALDISEPTVKRDWKTARAWLAKEVG